MATTSVEGPFEVLEITDNTVTLDLTAVQDLLVDQVLSDFASISLPGTYNVTVSASGVDMNFVDYETEITVQ